MGMLIHNFKVMIMKTYKTLLLYSAVMLLGANTAASAQMNENYASATTEPTNEITYITGGIGDEETQGMQAIKENYNLYIMSSNKDGSFTGDTDMTIADASGNVIIASVAGPLFYADLPDGKYTITAANSGVTQKKTATIRGSKKANVHFVWNSGY